MWRLVLLALTITLEGHTAGYEILGRIEPPAAVAVFLHGATSPFEESTASDVGGRFRFRNLQAGAYTIALATAARGQVAQTIELTPGTVDARSRLRVTLNIDPAHLESDPLRRDGVTVSSATLAVPEQARREFREAQHSLSRHQVSQAEAHLRRAVQIASGFTAAWNQLGTIAYQAGRFDDAEANFRRALDADPEAFEPLVNLGGVLLNLNRPQEALAFNQRAVARRSNDALANSQLGLTYFLENNPDMAERYLTVAVHLDPAHFSHPQLTLARIYSERGDSTSAEAQLNDFLRRHPDAPESASVRQALARMKASGKAR